MATGAPRRGVSPAGLLLLVAAAVLALPACAQPWQVCGKSGNNYTEKSPYQANIQLLSTTLPRNASSSRDLFAKDSVGTVPDIVYALALCRGDTNASSCGSCVANAFQDAQQLCAYDRDATVYYDFCHLRFSNTNFLATTTNNNAIILMNSLNVSSSFRVFDAAVATLLNATADHAAAANSTTRPRRFATGEEGFDSNNPIIYGLTQCTPDMSPADCQSCLADVIGMMPQYLSGRRGGRIIGVRCNFRYEVYSFFSGSPSLRLPAPASPPAPAPDPAPPANATPAATQQDSTNPGDIESIDSLLLDISTLRTATDNFAEGNRLGEGGFGAVYKGILPDGQEIAVKRLSQSQGKGYKS
ncbi:hypothetical protein PR202_gb21092 [Eleusine coracana subsp. coracana]|uniref:Uncharacterized protein n=1 Tax=Eleusine coracana subsp. coracana TaxID=191504 RepID=A0AAV5FAB1_ELECO|nr:hypothetical protein PR202_gb21092 [Eleusine coracana subsp. coracana]